MRFRLYPDRFLQELDRLEKALPFPEHDEDGIEIRGVITHIVNDARTGEFVDLPVL